MAKQTLNNGDSGFDFRNKINENTTELYDTTVKNTGDQTITGIKTFSDGIVANVTGNASTVTNGVYASGNQTIEGVKTFTSSPVVPDATLPQHPVTLNQGVLKTQIKQTTGTSEIDLMSQKAISTVFDNVVRSEWKLPATIGVKDGKLIALNKIPATNTEIAFYKKCKNAWGITATLKSTGVQPYYLNSGLILSETTDSKQFRMLKSIINASYGTDEFTYYTRNNATWLDNQKILLTNTINTVRVEKLGLFLSGDTAQCYRGDVLQFHKKTVSMPCDSRYNMNAGIIFNIEGNTVEDYVIIERPSPYAHFSVDDVGAVMKTVTDNASVMDSIFENSFFAFWKSMHDQYGVVVTFNLYWSISSNTFNLSMMTNKFKAELTANSMWLKFAFHGGDETIQYTDPTNNAACLTDYANTMTQIVRFASYANIDRFPRLTFFSGNKDLLIALKSTGMFIGCFTADDIRTANCGLNTIERNCINLSSDYVDIQNQLYYIRSSVRLDSPTDEKKAALIAEMDSNSRNVVYEYFNHGGQDQIIADLAIELNKRKVRFDFPQNNLPF